jgi:hypothetical protein
MQSLYSMPCAVAVGVNHSENKLRLRKGHQDFEVFDSEALMNADHPVFFNNGPITASHLLQGRQAKHTSHLTSNQKKWTDLPVRFPPQRSAISRGRFYSLLHAMRDPEMAVWWHSISVRWAKSCIYGWLETVSTT